MNTQMLRSLTHLSDRDLLTRVHELAQHERQATAILVAHLAELDARGLYLAEGCSSLFTYCTKVLHLSEHAAYGRIEAARTARKFPAVLERLAEGSVTLTTVSLLAPHLTGENHLKLLEMVRHKSKREVEELIAALRPQQSVPDLVRRLPARQQAPSPLAENVAIGNTEPDAGSVGEQDAVSSLPAVPARTPAAPSSRIVPLASERYKVQFTASAQTYEKLRRAQALLRHQIPDGDLDKIVDLALTALLHNVAKQKFAATERPRRSHVTADPTSRHIPAEVKRAVWIRDGGRCAFVSKQGRRCTEEGFLEFHHVRAYAAGGEATVDNIELRCRAHNAYEAELDFGPCDLAMVREAGATNSVRTEYLSVNEIGRTAQENGGLAVGKERFLREIGIRETDWNGKHWIRWGDALQAEKFM